jgi:outer membrane lipase/esterase
MSRLFQFCLSHCQAVVTSRFIINDSCAALRNHRITLMALVLGLCSTSTCVSAAAPVAVADARTVLSGRTITINVLANDFDADRDLVRVTGVTQPDHGSTRLNSDGSISYTPAEGFLGEVTFSYDIEDVVEASQTATATVTITIVQADLASVTGTDNNKSVAQVLDSACSGLTASKDTLSAGEQLLLQRCEGLLTLGLPGANLDNVLRSIAPEETASQFRVSSENSRQQTSAVSQRMSLLKQGANQFSVNGVSIVDGFNTGGAAGDEITNFNRFGLFASLQADGADRDDTDNEAGYEQSGLVFTFGADYAVSPQLFVGLAAGITDSDLDYNNDGGNLKTDIATLIGFATWHYQQVSVDFQVGYGLIDYDSKRHIKYADGNGRVDTTAQATTDGSQFMLNGQVQYDWYKDALTLYPFLRIDYVDSDIDAYGENNAAGLEIEFEDQAFSRLTLSTGVHGSYAVAQDWGVLIPTFQANILSETSVNQDDIVARFAFDPDSSNTFTLQQDDEDSLFYQLGIGVVATLPRGLSVFAEYMQTLGYANISIFQVQAGIRYEL